MSPVPFRRTEQELAQAEIGIMYRLTQMVGATYTLVLGINRAQVHRDIVHNALIESSLVNARVLAYFLSNSAGDNEEVTAFDFLPEAVWDRTVARSELGRDVIGTISDHLTHAKHVPPPDPWELLEMERQIVTHMNRFVDALRHHDVDRAGRFEATIVPLIRKLDHAEELAEADTSTPAVPRPTELTPRGSVASAVTSTTQSLG
jgi:hypothetical protein